MLLLAAACATLGTYQPARPIDAGTVQVGLEGASLSTHTPASGVESTSPIGVSVRYGLDPRTQIGLRAGMVAPEVTVLRRVVGAGDDDLAVSLAPGLGVWRVGTHDIPMVVAEGRLAVPIGVPTGRGSEVVGAPLAQVLWGHHLELPVWGAVVNVGGSVGWSIRVSRGVRAFPELSASWPMLWGGTDRAGAGGGFATQAGLAVQLGGEAR
jgi:hypothetical protein